MIKLSEFTRCSNISVTPANWKTGGKSLLKEKWLIHYRFYDDRYKEQYPTGKLIRIKGMNQLNTLEDRRAFVEETIKQELSDLKDKQWNPITQKSIDPLISETVNAHSYMSLINGLEYAKLNTKASSSTLSDMSDTIKAITPIVNELGLSDTHLIHITRKQIISILDKAALKKDGAFSGHKFNKYRAYLSIMFEYLLDQEVIQTNPVASIKKTTKGIIKRVRNVITEEEAVRVLEYLKSDKKLRPFFLFTNIFYHSGTRKTELLDVQFEDVDLINQRFKVTVKKDRVYTEHWVVIKNVAMPYWTEAMLKARPGDYIFGVNPVSRRMGFIPSKKKMEADRVRRIWHRIAKVKLGIDADFYTLKHLHTSKVAEAFDSYTAAKVNRHKGTVMVDKIYDTRKKSREDNIIKGMQGELGE